MTTILALLAALQIGAAPAPLDVTRDARASRIEGRPQAGVPQRNPDGSAPRRLQRLRAPVTIIVGATSLPDGFVAFPQGVGLPHPAYGLAWRRVGADAILVRLDVGSIVEVRSRWFG